MSQHTPGPWRVWHRDMQAGGPLITDRDGGVAIARAICRMRGQKEFLAEASANAQLIAAAPDLLSELRDFHDHTIDQGWHDCDGIPGGCPVANLLAKAEGESA